MKKFCVLPDRSSDSRGSPTEDEVGYEQEILRLHRREDLFKMHTYRDGILSTRGAYTPSGATHRDRTAGQA